MLQAGRKVMKVSPYDQTGTCYGKLEDVPEKATCSPAVEPEAVVVWYKLIDRLFTWVQQ